MTIFEHLRARLELAAGIWPAPPRAVPLTLADLEAEWSPEFAALMKNRIMMGTLRYGQMSKRTTAGPQYNHIADAIRRLRAYQHTGNTEHLVDAANMCLVEFVVGRHPNKHFAAHDDGPHTQPNPCPSACPPKL